MMPSVDPRPRSSSWSVVNGPTSSGADGSPHTRRYRPSTTIAIRLLAIGAHIIGPNRWRALST